MKFWQVIKNMININGKSYEGENITITNSKVFINGKEVGTEDSKQITITVTGNIENLKVDHCEKIDIMGTIKDVQLTSGNINCGNVTGNVKTTSGDVDCSDVGGSIQTVSGNVDASNIKGETSTVSGNIKYRK